MEPGGRRTPSTSGQTQGHWLSRPSMPLSSPNSRTFRGRCPKGRMLQMRRGLRHVCLGASTKVPPASRPPPPVCDAVPGYRVMAQPGRTARGPIEAPGIIVLNSRGSRVGQRSGSMDHRPTVSAKQDCSRGEVEFPSTATPRRISMMTGCHFFSRLLSFPNSTARLIRSDLP